MGDMFADVTPGSWFFNDVMELDDIAGEESPFISGIPFNRFTAGHEAVDELITITTPSTTVTVNVILTHTNETPVTVYVDGVKVLFNQITVAGSVSTIALKRQVAQGSIVRVIQRGVPLPDPDNANLPAGVETPWAYPQTQLTLYPGYTYSHNPFSSIGFEKVKFMGSELKKIPYVNGMPTNYNFFKTEYEYTISPSGIVYIPFSMDNSTIEIDYLQKNTSSGTEMQMSLKPTAQRPIVEGSNPPTRYKRVYKGFFPEASILRSQFLTYLNNLRKVMWAKFSDSDPFANTELKMHQSRFSDIRASTIPNISYRAMVTPTEGLTIYVVDIDKYYTARNNVWEESTGFWWWEAVRDLEALYSTDGSPILAGKPDGSLHMDDKITRAEIVTFLDKFRVWFIEAFR